MNSVLDRPHQIEARHLTKRAVVYIRQSSAEQVRDNTGSTEVQRQLAERARRWGWPESRITIIDDDLGVSGSHPDRRPGFQRLLELVDRDELAIVFVTDASRLSRNPKDAETFLHKAIYRGVLIDVNGQLFDAATDNLLEVFGFRLQSLIAWYDQANRTRTFQAAKRAKVLQGLAVSPPPLGFVRPARGKWIHDPDPNVREAFRRIFDLYLRLRSTSKVARYHHQHDLLFPRRVAGRIVWESISQLQIIHVLKNPNYTADYVYLRTKVRAAEVIVGARVERRPQEDWLVARDHHEAYVSRDEWTRIQQLLAKNRLTNRPPRLGGAALLQGLLWCGRCERRIRVLYQRRTKQGHLPAYICHVADRYSVRKCFWAPAERLDEVVAREVIGGLGPSSLKAAAAAIQESRDEWEATERARLARLRRVEAAVVDARRRYQSVDPGHQLVRTDLEAALEMSLRERESVRQELGQPIQAPALPTAADVAELRDLSGRIAALWNAPTTSNEDRKGLVQAAIARVEVVASSDEWVDMDVSWVGGLVQRCRAVRPKGIDVLVTELRGECHTSADIAARLRAAGVKSRAGGEVTRYVVSQRAARMGLQHERVWHEGLVRIRELVLSGLSTGAILAELQTNGPRHFRNRWTYQVVRSAIRQLRKGDVIHGVPPLPQDGKSAHLAKTPAEAVARIVQWRAQGRVWRAIADELNALGLHPAKATVFTDRRCAELFCTWRTRGKVPRQFSEPVGRECCGTGPYRLRVRGDGGEAAQGLATSAGPRHQVGTSN